jgi:hypothetical protein
LEALLEARIQSRNPRKHRLLAHCMYRLRRLGFDRVPRVGNGFGYADDEGLQKRTDSVVVSEVFCTCTPILYSSDYLVCLPSVIRVSQARCRGVWLDIQRES